MSAFKRVLLVAYHFPPLAGSSGIQRTLRFAQQLPALGWQPLVLTAHPRAYERTSQDLSDDVPAGTVVCRAQAWDTARHLAIRGRYVGAMARPDRWVSWRFDAVRQGMQLIRQHQPQAIWSTYPIATAHLIGAELQRRSGLPWVADFRDPMAQDGYPADPATWQQYQQIEQHSLMAATACTFTTPGAAAEYQRRYPQAAARVQVLENGYDEPSFQKAEAQTPQTAPLNEGVVTLLHSGIVYPSERDPTALMDALQALQASGRVAPGRLRIRFRAAVHDDLLQRLAAERGVGAWIETLPPVPYAQALQEMRCADGLLVLQSANCNQQIPAKVYEYLRAGPPVLGLTDPAGDTAGVLRWAGVPYLAPIDQPEPIAALMVHFLSDAAAGRVARPEAQAVVGASRWGRTQELAALLGRVCA